MTYANLNDFDPATPAVPLEQRSVLDRWVLARLNNVVDHVTEGLETYDVTGATRPIDEFVEELSNWYVRLSRRRFWNVEGDAETPANASLAAHQTMYEALVTLSKLLAPFTPFVADEIYRNLVCCDEADAPVSVHLSRWPEPDPAYANEQLIADMALAQRSSAWAAPRGRAPGSRCASRWPKRLSASPARGTRNRWTVGDRDHGRTQRQGAQDRDRIQRPGGSRDPPAAQTTRPEVWPPLPGDS